MGKVELKLPTLNLKTVSAMHALCQYFVDMNRLGLPPSHQRMRVPQTFPTANDQETIAAPVQRRRQSNFVLLPRGRKELPRDDFSTVRIGESDSVYKSLHNRH